MGLVYILLFITVASCFITKRSNVSLVILISSIITAYFYGIINHYGLLIIVGFYIITYIYFQHHIDYKFIKAILLILILVMSSLLSLHMAPGFNNLLFFDKVIISPFSIPFSMYLNFDKTITGIIIFMNSELYHKEKLPNIRSFFTVLLLLFLCSLILMTSGVLSGYIKFDFKIPDILFIWSINNLFFVCFAEAVIFIGLIQNKLKQLFFNEYLSLLMASLIFGLAHFQGGITYILLASIAGVFYGLTYQKTNRILCPILVHFGLNLVHLLFFTYPASI